MPVVLESADHMTATPSVLLRIVNRVAILKLNRPMVLNALSNEMVLNLTAALDRCRMDEQVVAVALVGAGEKAFCAGGDIRELHQYAVTKDRRWQKLLVDEYRLDYAIHNYPKPIIALLNGIVMGSGMGLAQGAWLRVATERTTMAMPQTRIGLVPDFGATYFMAQMPIEIQLYLALTGTALGGADAIFCNLADVYAPANWLMQFEERLKRVTSIALNPAFPDQLKRTLREIFQPSTFSMPAPAIRDSVPLIKHYFGSDSTVSDIIHNLTQGLEHYKSGEAKRWIGETLEALKQHSPTMLCVAREAMLRGRKMTLAECMRMELGIISQVIEEGDFLDGVRAHLIEKDRKPRWTPATICEVRKERVRYILSNPWLQKERR